MYKEKRDITQNSVLKEIRENAVQEVLKSIENHTFFDKFIYTSCDKDYYHIVDFIPDEFFQSSKNIYMLKAEARLHFISLVDKVKDGEEFLAVISARKRFSSSLEERVQRAKAPVFSKKQIEFLGQNLGHFKKQEKANLNKCFSVQDLQIDPIEKK